MADDAAGAVRRTPHPDDVPDRSHPPFHHDAAVRVSFTGRYYAGAFLGSHIVDADDHHRCTVPPDAVTLLPDGDVVERAARPLAVNALRRYEAEQGFADHLTADDFMADAREDVQALAADSLLADPQHGRPVVLLRAEDCACRYGDDCPHGPEPVDALDLAVWLHAEATYFRNWTLRAAELELASHGRAEDKLQARIAELEASIGHRTTQLGERIAELQARLDAVRTVLDRPWPDDEDHHDFVNGQVEAARAALQGDQPTEPDRLPLADRARMWLDAQPEHCGKHTGNCSNRCLLPADHAGECDDDPGPDEAHAVTELRRRINNALALTEPHPLRHWDTQWPIRAALEGMTAAEYAGEDGTDPVAAPVPEPTGEADRD